MVGTSLKIVLIINDKVFQNPVGRNPRQCDPLYIAVAMSICSFFRSNSMLYSGFLSLNSAHTDSVVIFLIQECFERLHPKKRTARAKHKSGVRFEKKRVRHLS